MEIILKEDIIGLGYRNDIVNVKGGYGRNFLIPTGKAVIASPSARKQLAEELKQRALKLEKQKADAQAVADKIAALKPIVIEAKVSATGAIYGSVSNIQLAEAIKAQGLEIDRKIIVLKDAKVVGEHTAKIHLHREVEVVLPFTVVAEGAAAQQPAEETPAEA